MGVYSINNLPEDFYKNNPIRYKAYRWNCGRDKRLKEIWGEKAKH
jgi:peptide-methionine (S)-S-oxide reductase